LLASAWVRGKLRDFLAKKATLADRRDARVRTGDRRQMALKPVPDFDPAQPTKSGRRP